MCIAGVTQDLRCIRPVTDGGVRIWSLYKSKKPIIYPGSKVWMDFSESEISPPHIEDRTFDPLSVEHKDSFSQRHWETLLRKISYGSVQDVFDGYLEVSVACSQERILAHLEPSRTSMSANITAGAAVRPADGQDGLRG